MTVKINKPAINLREELASLRNQGGLPKEDKLYLDNLVTNGDFSNGLSGWTSQVAGFTVTGGEAVGTSANGLYPQMEQTFKVDIGKTYKVNVGKAQINSGYWLRVRVSHGGTTDTLVQNNSSGSNVNMTGDAGLAYFTARSSEVTISLEVRDGAVGTFDNVSVQEVGENLVTNGTFDNGTTGWTSYGASGSVTSGVMTVTNGSTAHQGLVQNFKVTVGRSYTISGKVTGGTSTAKLLIGSSQGNGNLHNTTVLAGATSTINVNVVPTSANFFVSLQIDNANGTGLYEDIIVTEGNHHVIQSIPYGYDVKDVYIDGDLAREGEAYDYEVKTDGINQWLKPSVEPTATTETVVIGVRK